MAALFSTAGPTLIYVQMAGQTTIQFLGEATVSPEVLADVSYLGIMTDSGGRSKVAQKIYDRESHEVTFTAERFDMNVWRQCRNAVDHSAATNTLGIDGRYEGGRLIQGLADLRLILVNDFYGSVAANADLRQGRMYYSAVLSSYREITSGGNRVTTIQARFDCDGLFNPTDRQWYLYTEDLSSISGQLIPN